MKKIFILILFPFFVSVLSSCEDGGATSTDSFYITPADVTIAEGDTVKLSATGGMPPYKWTMSNDEIGQLSETEGPVVTYHALGEAIPYTGTNSIPTTISDINTITVTDGHSWVAKAVISHRKYKK